MNDRKNIKITYTWGQHIQPSNQVGQELAVMDALEILVSVDDCSEAKSMLAAIGIRC